MSTSESLQNLITIKTMTMDEKIKFWQQVMAYAKDRGIDIYIFTWNTFIYGTEASDYGFTISVTDKKTEDYFRKSVSAISTRCRWRHLLWRNRRGQQILSHIERAEIAHQIGNKHDKSKKIKTLAGWPLATSKRLRYFG